MYLAVWALFADLSDYGACVQEEVQEAAKLANGHDFMLALPHGYATKVSPHKALHTMQLSERAAIAR